jgi:type IV pilus assembly protein PilC
VNAGIPLRDAIESIAQDVDSAALRRIQRRVVSQLHDGRALSEALSGHSRIFGVVFVSLIRCAEESGSMPQTLNQLANYLESQERLRRKVRSATAYPMFVLVFFCIVCAIMTLFVLPRFQGVFADSDAELPRLTTAVFGVNEFVLDNLVWIALTGAAALTAFSLFKRTRKGRYQVDRMKLRLPFFGEILRKYAVARLCRNLAIMIRGGVPVTTAIDITSSVTGNTILSRSLLKVKDRIMSGSDIAGSLRQDPHFPRLFVRMVSVGESSGQLPEVMNKLSDVYEDQVEGQITVAMALFEPLIICFFGAVVLLLVLAIYMPVFTVASKV